MVISEAFKKKAKKIWVKILAPDGFRAREIGDTNVYLPEQIVNRIITVNLASITEDPKKQNSNIVLKVNSIKENKAVTEIIGYDLMSSYLKRLNRMSKVRMEQSMPLKTKDGVEIRIKIMALSKYETKNAVFTAVRAKMKEFLMTNVQSLDYKDLMGKIITFEFQKDLNRQLRVIYPLSYVLVKSVRKLK